MITYDYIGWNTSKIISVVLVVFLVKFIIKFQGCLAYGLRSTQPRHRRSGPTGTPPALSLKRGKIGPRLPVLHTRFRFVPKWENRRLWMTLNGH